MVFCLAGVTAIPAAAVSEAYYLYELGHGHAVTRRPKHTGQTGTLLLPWMNFVNVFPER